MYLPPVVRRKSACKTSPGSSKILRWLTPLLGPNLDPKTGPKQRPKRRNENVIQFWTPFWGHIWTKNGVSHRRISLLPAHVVQADLRPCSLNMNVNSYLFLFVRPKSGCYLSRSLYRGHVLTTFLGLVLGAMMMKQVCWHSPCHCFLMLALLRPSRRTRQNRSRQQSAASGC